MNLMHLDPDLVVEAQTDLGPIWAERRAAIVTRSLLEHGHWDPVISGLMRKALEPGMTFVDAGANIGYFSILASHLVGPEGRVVAIEPDAINLSILGANLDRHGCSNVTVLPVAAWSEHTHLRLERPPDEGAGVRVGGPRGGGEVPAAPLDDLVDGTVDYLKVDCELTDHVVVRGAERLLQENPSTLVTVEFAPWDQSHTGESPREILDQYRRMGLIPYEISPWGRGVRRSTYKRIAKPKLPDGHISFDFALSRALPDRLVAKGFRVMEGPRAFPDWFERLLARGGDMLERVPQRIRPPIRRRDRKALK
jgi:FkbM family methyltransferase